MKILVLGSGMMGQAITYDLCNFSNFEKISIADMSKQNIKSAKKFLNKIDVGDKGYSLLYDTVTNTGKADKRWRIIVNG